MNNSPTVNTVDPRRHANSSVTRGGRAARHVTRRARSRALAARQSSLQQNELHDRLRLLEADLDLAWQVQSSLLPRTMPQLHGLDVFATSRPARYLGGDFYDFIDESTERLAFSLGDVAGKGASAALLMSALHQSVRTAAALLSCWKPSDLLTYVNKDLFNTLAATQRFVTTFVGWYDRPNCELTYANAGHGIVLHCPYRQPARLLSAENLPLGIFSDTTYSDRTLQLAPGDLLVIATDGLPEAGSPSGELFGYERLTQLVERVAAGSAEEIGYALLNAVHDFHANSRGQMLPQEDDQTLLVIKQMPI